MTSLTLPCSRISFWAHNRHTDCLLEYMQRGVLDFMALTQGCVCSLKPAVHNLTRNLPLQRSCSIRNVVMLPATTALLVCVNTSIILYLKAQNWYHQGTGSSYQVLLTLSMELHGATPVTVRQQAQQYVRHQ